MKTIKVNSQRGQSFLNSYKNSTDRILSDVYKTNSCAKNRAFDYCKDLCNKEDGSNFKIISRNTFAFTAAWSTNNGLRVETAANSYLIK